MANSQLYLPSGFPTATLGNGIGRHICQLKRVVLKYCKHNGSSLGMRDFLEHDLLDFAKKHPSVVVYVKPRRNRGPVLKAEYCNGGEFWLPLTKLTREDIIKWINLCATQGSGDEFRYRKFLHTNYPSIQGPWTPFTHRNPLLNSTTFPDEDLSRPVYIPKSASEKLIEIFKEQQSIEEKRAE